MLSRVGMSLTAVDAPAGGIDPIVGRSLRQIVWARVRRDKVAMTCLFILNGLYLIVTERPR